MNLIDSSQAQTQAVAQFFDQLGQQQERMPGFLSAAPTSAASHIV